MNLINKPEDQPTFYSRRWRTTSTPDLAFCTDDIDGQINREVRGQLGGNDHRPVLLTMSTYISCESTLPRWNYKKADWKSYSQLTDQVTKYIRVEGRDINKVVKYFNAGIMTATHKSIHRGARETGKDWKDWMMNYLQPEGKLNPTLLKTITVTYNIPKPDFSGTSYKLGGKADETKQIHITWIKMVVETDKAT